MHNSLHSFLTTSSSEEFEYTKRIMSVNRRRTDKTMTKKRTKGQTMAYKILNRILKTGQDEPTKNSVELHRILKTEQDEPTKNRVELHRILKTELDEPTKNSVELHRILKTE